MQRGGKALSPPGGASSAGRAVQHLACRRWFLLLFFFSSPSLFLFFPFSLFLLFLLFSHFPFFLLPPFVFFLGSRRTQWECPRSEKGYAGKGRGEESPVLPPPFLNPPQARILTFFPLHLVNAIMALMGGSSRWHISELNPFSS